ncbi:MAG: hypothetical protein L6428_09395 [Candidatus Aminicenantes bacterium]|nr:hypothetical protein [Acidobacteriota bacterium]MCG2811658.1 hypothetical protein [Candidatus Aminicenantes bacterium]
MEMMIKVIARFIDKVTKRPLSGNDYVAKLYDNDVIGDDFLGESKLDEKGTAEILLNLDAGRSADSPFEAYPDLYFALHNKTGVVFESKVFKNVDFISKEEISGEHRSNTQDLGTFEV